MGGAQWAGPSHINLNQENVPLTCLQVSLMEAVSQLRFLFPDDPSLCALTSIGRKVPFCLQFKDAVHHGRGITEMGARGICSQGHREGSTGA